MKLLIDECLSAELTKRAQQRGHQQASHVTWIGKRGWKDWQLKKVVLDGDWTLVTKNSIDFSGPANACWRTKTGVVLAVTCGRVLRL